MELVVRSYTIADAEDWNALNQAAPNGHFLFNRHFMEYHADRFVDASLVVEENGILQGLLPANRAGQTVHSHGGLTFGGFVTVNTSTPAIMRWLDAIAAHLRNQDVKSLIYKALPHIYHRQPAGADLYWLFRQHAILVRRDITTTIDYRQPGSFSSRRLRGIKKSAKAHLTISACTKIEEFWHLLHEVLRSRHNVAPVHTSEELKLLMSRFPQNIRLFTATHNESIVAGVLIFESETVAHAQYIAANETGRNIGALDGLFDFLIRHYADIKRFFDFGISTEESGRLLNEGLIAQKEEFGGSGVTHDVYQLDLSRSDP